ncbi:MAG: hypothetical protein B6D61_05470 [Bacteroidetes bacterium 4484_249]|nr:MAG: hypothetical protein B6D61_05470 [Bacteroidetes bacterium 4484_249]
MDNLDIFSNLNITDNFNIPIVEFIINSLILIVFSFVLERTYLKCANSISNRKMFAANFMLISFTTMVIIAIVKNSVALSLGLVGALSIVRFRSAIKEPEELAYLFLTIAIGLGLGANQRLVTIIAFFIIIIILWARYFLKTKEEQQNLYFTVSSNPSSVQLGDIISAVNKVFGRSEVRRYDKNPQIIEVSFLVDIKNTDQLQVITQKLEELNKSVKVTFIDNSNY